LGCETVECSCSQIWPAPPSQNWNRFYTIRSLYYNAYLCWRHTGGHEYFSARYYIFYIVIGFWVCIVQCTRPPLRRFRPNRTVIRTKYLLCWQCVHCLLTLSNSKDRKRLHRINMSGIIQTLETNWKLSCFIRKCYTSKVSSREYSAI